MKTCSKCKTVKSFDDFGKHNQTKDGYRSRCKICNSAEKRDYYANNADLVKKSVADWIEKNKNKHAKYVQTWLTKNLEQKKKSDSLWKVARKDLVNASTQKRRAAQKNQLGFVSQNIVQRLMAGQRSLCINCKVELHQSGYHIDHIMPLSLGGIHSDWNLQLLCPTCNIKKSNKDPIAWAHENGRLL
jgi:5-methylcytosine-specific restriction endonuclease McrA